MLRDVPQDQVSPGHLHAQYDFVAVLTQLDYRFTTTAAGIYVAEADGHLER